jgi:hypothetical protein
MSPAKRLTAYLIVIAACVAVLLGVRDWSGRRSGAANPMILPPGPDVEALTRRMRAKELVVEQVLEGEMSLSEAAARFEYLNEQPPHLRVNLEFLPGKSKGEKLYRQVILWMKNHLRQKGMTSAEVAAALWPYESELNRLLAENEEIVLPPVD